MPAGIPTEMQAQTSGKPLDCHLSVPGEGILRVTAFPPGGLVDYPSYGVEGAREELPVRDSERRHEARTGGYRAFWEADGGRLVVEGPGGRTVIRSATPGLVGTDQGVAFLKAMAPGERVYGLGERGEMLDRARRRHRFWNMDDHHHHPEQDFYCQVPFSLHFDGAGWFGVFLDNPGLCEYDLGVTDHDTARFLASQGNLDLYFFLAETPREILRLYTDLTGRIVRPPLWAIGYHQCRWTYQPDAMVRDIARRFRERHFPCDVIFLDFEYMRDGHVFEWDPVKFPDGEGLVRELNGQGFHVVASLNPAVARDEAFPVWQEFNGKGWFLAREEEEPWVGHLWAGASNWPDFTRTDVRMAWGRHIAESIFDKGVEGLWNDMNEPAVFYPKSYPAGYTSGDGEGLELWDRIDTRTLPEDLVHEDEGFRRAHGALHNVYGATFARASAEAFDAHRPDRRPFVLSRSGWAGVQRHAAVWTGDNFSNWSQLEFDIQLNLSMGLAGIPFVGCDIGGFGGDGNAELFMRWIEWGVFQPYCRVHSREKTHRQEPWSFGEEAEGVARRMVETRMRLLPYLYTLFVEAAETGAPVNRPLFFEYPEDRRTHALGDEFLLGRDVLVAPVLQPGRDRRLVYLPGGSWVHLFTGGVYTGGKDGWHVVMAPPGSPPVFVRAGGVVPAVAVAEYTDGIDWKEGVLELAVDPAVAHSLSGSLVEDDGRTREYREPGGECRIGFGGRVEPKGGGAATVCLEISEPVGGFRRGRERWRVRLLNAGCRITAVEGDGSARIEDDGSVVVEDRGGSIRLVLEVAP